MKPEFFALLQSGSRGPDVALVQRWLNTLHDECTLFPVLRVDGRYGPDTKRAVTAFQALAGLAADGKVGRATWDALYKQYSTLDDSDDALYPGIQLREGQRGAVVRQMQRQLRGRGYENAADGYFGARTKAAVERFQAAADLPVDGIVGPETWDALFDE